MSSPCVLPLLRGLRSVHVDGHDVGRDTVRVARGLRVSECVSTLRDGDAGDTEEEVLVLIRDVRVLQGTGGVVSSGPESVPTALHGCTRPLPRLGTPSQTPRVTPSFVSKTSPLITVETSGTSREGFWVRRGREVARYVETLGVKVGACDKGQGQVVSGQ